MSRTVRHVVALSALVASGAACGRAGAPTAPTAITRTAGISAAGTLSNDTLRTHGEILTAVVGQGSGVVNVSPTAAVAGSFSAEIEVNVHGTSPDTTFFVQRAPEIGRALGSDGICQRALGLAPWEGGPAFVTFPRPAAGPLVTLQTSAGGSGSVHIDFTAPAISDGTRFDVMFRVVDDLFSPTNDLRTGCFTVEVK